MTSVDRPEILLLSLAFEEYFDDLYSPLLDQLNRTARIKRAKSTNSAIRYLDENNPRAIIVTDSGLAKQNDRSALDKVLSYARNGGLVIVGLQFPNFTNGPTFDNFFKNMGLPWKRGDYHRTTFKFNPSCSLHAVSVPSSFPGPYSMKVLHVMDARPGEKIFVPVPDAQTQSNVFPPEYVDRMQAAVVGTKMGDGHLVYCGDVNAEQESLQVISSLCGL